MKTLQGHLTDNIQSCVDNDAAQVLASSPKDVLNSIQRGLSISIIMLTPAMVYDASCNAAIIRPSVRPSVCPSVRMSVPCP